jgi:hypothetical protein
MALDSAFDVYDLTEWNILTQCKEHYLIFLCDASHKEGVVLL